jgi:alpha-glucoside transport system substrate-binding protein
VGLVEFLASSGFGTHGYGASGHWISPRTDFDLQVYPDDIWREIAGIAYASTEFVLDGSDRMPDEASRSFGLEMTAWISGAEDSRTALDNVEESWPT